MPMRAVETPGRLSHDADLFEQRELFSGCDDLLKILAFEILHGDECQTLVVPELVDRHDILVTEAPGGGGFRPDARDEVLTRLGHQDLDGDQPADSGIERAEHGAESASAQLRLNLVFSQTLERGIWHSLNGRRATCPAPT